MEKGITFGTGANLELGTGVLGTGNQLSIDNTVMKGARERKRNLAVVFYDYQKAYDMVRHDWMTRVYHWMGIPGKVIMVLRKLKEVWKTRLDAAYCGNVTMSRSISNASGFLQGENYSPMGFHLTEVPVAMIFKETNGYKMELSGD